MARLLTSLRRHLCGLLEAHFFASFIAMAVTAAVAAYEQLSGSTLNGLMGIFVAPFALPVFLLYR